MLGKEDFTKWIKASHDLFEIFENRHVAYSLARKWVDEWFKDGKFNVENSDREKIYNLIDNLNLQVFYIENLDRIKNELYLLLEEVNKRQDNVGFALSFYFFTWNLQRFKEYFEKKDNFSLLNYFEEIGNKLGELKNHFEYFRDKHLIYQRLEEEKVKNIYHQVQERLKSAGIGKNEPVGTIKILHIFSPTYFPLLDNPIAEHVGLKRPSKYITWMKVLKSYLENYKDEIKKLEKNYGYSILKLVDEGLYIMCSISWRKRVDKLGIKITL